MRVGTLAPETEAAALHDTAAMITDASNRRIERLLFVL
jgi:hypothetical protein